MPFYPGTPTIQPYTATKPRVVGADHGYGSMLFQRFSFETLQLQLQLSYHGALTVEWTDP
ncbi:hypothetical protein BGZ89_007307, partial [Linnemannia elongata]